MIQKLHYDIVVIGSGPAGESAAMNAAKKGRRVAVVSDRAEVGGNCTHLGTIPSKALRQSVKQVMQFDSNPLLREFATLRKPSLLSRPVRVPIVPTASTSHIRVSSIAIRS